ncbi:AraC family transcriptional regulator [Pedobacter sp. ISL-68]|uniref:helix-turn-helix domain-containing protein n=1 Tax=unclassified Pedobacter TaxID=2628915 RepID=UPI001BEACEE4|nr:MULTISPECIES: helix-turn-helix transcriptional regulator [unclassified Pedobacter]MBT2560190.1 AraC family transcriptional regulator [Pedobacter sp. ISL-64]MBT2589169.1 AraC family transcriptional regulator [Pedobacter sp. ISL-68]
MQHFKSLSEMARSNGMAPPEHPLLALIRIQENLVINQPEFTSDCYMIGLKKVKAGFMIYGRTKLDHETGSMVFIKPRQVVEMKNLEFEEDGYILFFHEDFLNGHSLNQEIQKYSFFDYETNEALHLAPKEEKVIWNLFNTIELEYNNNEDEFSREIIMANINSILKYAERFYKRQFINRKPLSGKTVTEFNKVLAQYIEDGSILQGLPSVAYLAERLNISRRYLTDLLKIETGKTTQDLIHLALINEAKNRLRTNDSTVSEIAYALGFENMSYFSRLFKRETGVSPSSFVTKHIN